MRIRPGFAIVAALLPLVVACGPTVDLSTSLEVVDVSTGWHDAGIVQGNNKLVPSVTFKVKNNSDQRLPVLQVNALFRRVNEPDEWGSDFRTVVGSEGLEPGATSNELTLRSNLGYTGTEARAEMLKNSQFVDAKVELFAKYGSTQWARIGDFPVTRELIQPGEQTAQ
jgi:hypothetical protein